MRVLGQEISRLVLSLFDKVLVAPTSDLFLTKIAKMEGHTSFTTWGNISDLGISVREFGISVSHSPHT